MTITANVICALSTFLFVIRLCEGVKIGNEKIRLTNSTSIQIRNGQQYLKHVECAVINTANSELHDMLLLTMQANAPRSSSCDDHS